MSARVWTVLGWLGAIALCAVALSEGWFGELAVRVGAFVLGAGILILVLSTLGVLLLKGRRAAESSRIAAIPEDVIETIQGMQTAGRPFAECRDWLISRGLSRSTADRVMANAVPDPAPDDAARARLTPQDLELERFLAQTYAAWRSGAWAHINDAYAAEARTTTLPKFTRMYLDQLGERARASFAQRPPSADEVLLTFVDSGFLLTSRRLYVFHPRCPPPAPRTLPLSDIETYEVKGRVTFDLVIRLRGGEVLSFDKLGVVVAEHYVRQLQAPRPGRG